MTLLQVLAMVSLSLLALLAAAFPRRLAPPPAVKDPFLGFEDDWRSVMRPRT